MGAAKIQFSQQELALVRSAELILTKNAIIQKFKFFLEALQAKQKNIIALQAVSWPEEVTAIAPKVSKGENYRGLPWLVLDYPRYFSSREVFAIRTLFWWGNFFSTTLHLSGGYKDRYQQRITNAYALLAVKDFSFCVGDSEWQHHFEAGNYCRIKEMGQAGFSERVVSKSFLKIARKIPIDRPESLERQLCEDYELLVTLCR